jgi:hypothetical protein
MNLLEMIRDDPRPRASARSATLALVLAGLASFQVAATAYYGLYRIGGEFDRNPATGAIVGLVGAIGLAPSILLGGTLLVRAAVAFAHGLPRGLGSKLLGLLLAPLLFASLLGAIGDGTSGGALGRAVGGAVAATLGSAGAGIFLAAGTAIAALLAVGLFHGGWGPRRASEPPLPDEGAFGGVSVEEARGLVGEEEAVEEGEEPLPDDGWPAGGFEEASPPQEGVEIEELYGSIGVGPLPAEEAERVEPEALPDPEVPEEVAVEPGPPDPAPGRVAEDDEALLGSAAEAIFEADRASVSVLQQSLSIPFVRASRLLDRLEREGLVGPYQGGSSRAILLTREAWEERIARG